MTDRFLFATAPYVAAAALPAVLALRYLFALWRGDDLGAARARATRAFRGMWTPALLVLFAGHLIGLLLPDRVIAWNDVPWRLYVLEGTAFLAGAWALLALLGLLRRALLASGPNDVCPADLALLSALLVAIVSGLAVAGLYRWASTWSAVTLTPYWLSLLQLEPRLDLVASMPYLVKLHLFSGTVLLALLPWTSLAHVVLHPVHRTLSFLGRPLAWTTSRARPRVNAWHRRAVGAAAAWWDEED
jgi:nitrate reductase gamma subunit